MSIPLFLKPSQPLTSGINLVVFTIGPRSCPAPDCPLILLLSHCFLPRSFTDVRWTTTRYLFVVTYPSVWGGLAEWYRRLSEQHLALEWPPVAASCALFCGRSPSLPPYVIGSNAMLDKSVADVDNWSSIGTLRIPASDWSRPSWSLKTYCKTLHYLMDD